MHDSLVVPSEFLRNRLGLNQLSKAILQENYTFEQRQHYQAAKNWLSGHYQFNPQRKIDELKCYLQAFEYFVAVSDWPRVSEILISSLTGTTENEEDSVTELLLVWSYYQDVVQLCKKAVDFIQPTDRLLLLSRLGSAYTSLHQYQNAIETYQTCLNLATELGQLRIAAHSIQNLGSVYVSLRDYTKALQFLQDATKLSEEISDDRLTMAISLSVGAIYNNTGDYSYCIEWMEKSLAIAQKIGDRFAEGMIVGDLGMATSCLGQYQQAEAYFSSALEICEELGDRQGKLVTLTALGNHYNYKKDHQNALQYHQQGYELAKKIGDQVSEANILSGIGNSYFFLEDYAQAHIYFERSKELSDQINYPLGSTIALANIGTNLGKLHQLDSAITILAGALEAFRQLQAQNLVAMTAFKLAEIYHQVGSRDLTRDHLDFATSIAQMLSLPLIADCQKLEASMELMD